MAVATVASPAVEAVAEMIADGVAEPPAAESAEDMTPAGRGLINM